MQTTSQGFKYVKLKYKHEANEEVTSQYYVFQNSYAIKASVNEILSDGIQALSQPGGILFIAVLIAHKGLISAT